MDLEGHRPRPPQQANDQATDLRIRPFRETDREPLVSLWQQCDLVRPWNDPDTDIDRKVAASPDLLLVGTVSGRLVASVMAGYDGHRGWINYLAVAPHRRRAGFAALLMQAAEARLRDLGCPKINLQIRRSNLDAMGFYQSIGYATDDVVSMGRRLISDEPHPASADRPAT